MIPVFLDTHVLVWFVEGVDRLGPQSRQKIDQAIRANSVRISAISFWEIALLVAKGRLSLSLPLNVWRQAILAIPIQEISLTGEIGISAVELKNFHRDPADRLITATAMATNAVLITADHRILTWVGSVQCQNALQ